jgi:hypothetical protein
MQCSIGGIVGSLVPVKEQLAKQVLTTQALLCTVGCHISQ